MEEISRILELVRLASLCIVQVSENLKQTSLATPEVENRLNGIIDAILAFSPGEGIEPRKSLLKACDRVFQARAQIESVRLYLRNPDAAVDHIGRGILGTQLNSALQDLESATQALEAALQSLESDQVQP